jgi:DNA-binding NtrC family response regulator
MAHALLVDDNIESLEALGAVVEREGFVVDSVTTLAGARDAVKRSLPDVILLDLKLPDGEGLELLEDLDEVARPDVVLITGHASVDTAVAALRERVTDYLVKPLDLQRLRSILHHVIRNRELRHEIDSLRDELRKLGRFGRFVGVSAPIQKVYDLIARVAPTAATVLITGESGTGKEIVARTIHDISDRRRGPFRAVNCGAIASDLLDSELFGHEKGAFTGAERRRHGYFEQAASGTLFLDEITEMPLDSQVRLLRVLESGEMTRVGGEKAIPVDVRVVTATNRSPDEAVDKGALRQDLYYRLKVFAIDVPPLRDRDDDIELLARHFLQELNREVGEAKRFSDEAVEALVGHHWPGNVRELKNAVHSAFILADDVIEVGDLPPEVASDLPPPSISGRFEVRPGTSIADAERRLIMATLDHHDGNRTRAAHSLGISVKTLYNRLKAYSQEDAD